MVDGTVALKVTGTIRRACHPDLGQIIIMVMYGTEAMLTALEENVLSNSHHWIHQLEGSCDKIVSRHPFMTVNVIDSLPGAIPGKNYLRHQSCDHNQTEDYDGIMDGIHSQGSSNKQALSNRAKSSSGSESSTSAKDIIRHSMSIPKLPSINAPRNNVSVKPNAKSNPSIRSPTTLTVSLITDHQEAAAAKMWTTILNNPAAIKADVDIYEILLDLGVSVDGKAISLGEEFRFLTEDEDRSCIESCQSRHF